MSETMMRTALYDRYGEPGVLYEGQTPIPAIKQNEVMVRVHAASVNAIDVTVRSGALKFFTGRKFPRGTGLDFSGEIVQVGVKEQGFKAGDRVWGCLPHGALGSASEYVSVPAEQLSLIPAKLDSVTAAALPVVGATSIFALRDITKLQAGERLLVRGGSGGVGSVAVQLGHALGAHVTALASTHALAFVRNQGANLALDYKTTAPNELGHFDVIFDTVGSETWTFRRLLSANGRMVTICPDPKRPLTSFLYIFASMIFGSRRVRFFRAKPKQGVLRDLGALVEQGKIRPLVDAIYPLAEIAHAHQAIETGRRLGKQIVSLKDHARKAASSHQVSTRESAH